MRLDEKWDVKKHWLCERLCWDMVGAKYEWK